MGEMKQLSRMMDDEIRDAHKYAEAALEHKEAHPELSKIFANLSEQELSHYQMLYAGMQMLIDDQQRVFGEPDEGMKTFGKYVREKQLSDITDVRIMLQVWRE
jgi:hypothetical protein